MFILDFIKKTWANLWKVIGPSWMKFAHIFGEINQSILLGVLYFLVIGIYAIILKPALWIKSFYQKLRGNKKTSNWKTFTDNQLTLEDLEKSF